MKTIYSHPSLSRIESMFPQVVCLVQYDAFLMIHTILVVEKETKSIIFKYTYSQYDIIDPIEAEDRIVEYIIDAIKKHYSEDLKEDTRTTYEKRAHYCESCGAPLQKGSAVCVYCGTEIY